MSFRRHVASAAVCAAVAGGAQQAKAHEGALDVDAAMESADFVFEGVVERIDFASSRAVEGQPALPHTFVTYRIGRVFKGRSASPTVTLRFLGGRLPNGGFMSADGPMFDLRDRDLLFVDANGASDCPLVECGSGRFRIVGDLVYSDAGQEVALSSEGTEIRLGVARDLPEVRSWGLAGLTLVSPALVDQDAVQGGVAPPAERPRVALRLADFSGFLERRRGVVLTPQELAAVPPVVSQQPVAGFAPSLLRPALAEDRRPSALPPPADAAERVERDAFDNNGQNPVIR